ncbi:MAG: sugar ABC transporter ATP-binding protein [Candidatus Hydrogenedentes bacterium]|nr:sugar ABC transporter ATP-binding protein [Candidatus Hydrogenedentota bacterium]
MRGIKKRFAGVEALRGVDLSLNPGECLAICGENGAGKSTLINVLGGVFPADEGEILLDGNYVNVRNPHAAERLGIAVIHQEFNLVPQLSATENIVLGHEKTRFGLTDCRSEKREITLLLDRIGVSFDPEKRCADITIAQQQAVEIAKALHLRAQVIVMDEPSATLTERETLRLFEIINELKSQGFGIIYVSHRVEEIFEIAESVMVLRDGEHIATKRTEDIDKNTLVELMVGRTIDAEFPKRSVTVGEEILRVDSLCNGKDVRNVSFAVREGEVLGLAGLVGAGRTETVRLLFGADRPTAGDIYLDGKPVSISNPRDAIRQGICLLAEDRRGQGLIVDHSARENFGLPNLDLFGRGPFVDSRKERQAFMKHARSLQIKLSSPEQSVKTLSGGNQQKVVLAKWLERNYRVMICDEPTRGIDVGTKYEIYLLINKLASQGKAIVMISSELPEILGMSDRIVVMHEGEVKVEITDVASATQEQIMSIILGTEQTQ